MKITTGKKARPRNVLLYGEHGSGKTTLAATFPNPVIIDVEGGSDDIDVARTDRVLDYAAYQAALSWLVTAEHEFKTAITDSIDWLEALVWQHVAQANGEKSIEGIGYGKGYKFAAECFDHLVSGYRALNKRGIATILICHAKSVKHSPPGGDSYDRIEPDLHERVQSMLLEFCDEVLFLSRKTFTRSEDLGFNRERKIAIADAERILITSDTAAVVAKNRLQMPTEIPATFAAYSSYIGERPKNDIEGIVVNGSSKKRETASV